MNESTLFTAAFALYILSALVYLASLLSGKVKWAQGGFVLAAVGAAVHTGALIIRTVVSGHAPFTNMYESVSFLSWAMVLAFIIIDRKYRIPKVAPYLMLIVVALVAVASSPLMPKEVSPLVPALQSYWLWLHISVTLFGEAFFAVAFIASILYLTSRTEEKRQAMDLLSYRAVAVGFPLFTLGGLIFGIIWAYKAWGSPWVWDPKEVWSLITWLVFALYLHTRVVHGWKGTRSAVVVIIGFLAALFTYFGVNYLMSGLHSYA